MSDHGEEFYDHKGFGHGVTLYREQLSIPLYLIQEDLIQPNQVRDDPVQVLDIFPTLGALANRNLSGLDLPGHDLLASGDSGQNISRFSYAETYKGKTPCSVQSERYKLIYNSLDKDFEFYNIAEDPQEQNPVSASGNSEMEALRTELLRILELANKRFQSQSKTLDKETIQELKSLGYIK
jgi:arylsulfatase A-like enzyme